MNVKIYVEVAVDFNKDIKMFQHSLLGKMVQNKL